MSYIPKKLIRKREVLISKVSIYIVIIIVMCHSVRLIPTIWEITQTFLQGDEDEVRSIFLRKKLITFVTRSTGPYHIIYQ